MARTNPIARLRNVALETAKAPAAVAGGAMGLARSTARKGASALASLVAGTKDSPAPPPTEAPPTEAAPTEAAPTEAAPTPAPAPPTGIDPDQPVNVTEQLGLDPSPVAKPKRARTASPRPVTRIDADADPADVDVTPADVAEAVSHRTSSSSPRSTDG